MVYEMCRKFADEELAPNAGMWDKKHEFPQQAVTQLVRRQPGDWACSTNVER
jgi:hypothetical protein